MYLNLFLGYYEVMFEYTKKGCSQATKYLKKSGNYNLIEKELSTDGYTIVALANNLLELSQKLEIVVKALK